MSVTISQPTGLSFQDHRRCIQAIIGGSIGNLVEWYDFYIYSFGSKSPWPWELPEAVATKPRCYTDCLHTAAAKSMHLI